MDEMVAEVQQWLKNMYSFDIDVDGVTGTLTFTALIMALQTEIGVTVDGSFGDATLAACPTMQEVDDVETAVPSNLTYILQGSFWCKGYNPGGFTGIFGSNTANAVKEFESDAGLDEDGIVAPYILQGIMNTDGYVFTDTGNLEAVYKHDVQIGMNKYYGSQIGLIAPNGTWERKSHKNLIKSCQIEWGVSVDGVWGTNTMNSAPIISINTSGYTNSKRLLQWTLVVNGFYGQNLDGDFDGITRLNVISFQELLALDADGIVGKNTWASLLSSCGNTSRTVTAFDTSTRLTAVTAESMRNDGYEEVGRYLTNAIGGIDKALTEEEITIIEDAGLKVFPIFQTYGRKAEYFTQPQGQQDAMDAREAAQKLGFPTSTTIYFAVDYDVLTAEISTYILPYFTGVNQVMGASYKVGVYAPRSVCNSVSSEGLATSSYVADMSSGFTGNIGVKMPSNWSYDQILETTVNEIAIDKCVASDRSTAISPSEFVSYDGSDDTFVASDIKPIELIYELAFEKISGDAIADFYVFDENLLTLQYLRSDAYNTSAWALIAGSRSMEFDQDAAEKYESIVPAELLITNPADGFQIHFNHYAATLNACLYETMGLDIEFVERDVDAFAGWAGDLMQMAAIVQRSYQMGYNYFNLDDLMQLIGSTTESLDGYHLYDDTLNDDGDYTEMTSEKLDSGFSLDDLYADVDAYNISQIYNLEQTPIYLAVNDYYYGAKYYLKRYTTFRTNLLEQFNKDTVYDVAIEFTKEEIPLLSFLFEYNFGFFFESGNGDILARAFEAKINALVETEY